MYMMSMIVGPPKPQCRILRESSPDCDCRWHWFRVSPDGRHYYVTCVGHSVWWRSVQVQTRKITHPDEEG